MAIRPEVRGFSDGDDTNRSNPAVVVFETPTESSPSFSRVECSSASCRSVCSVQVSRGIGQLLRPAGAIRLDERRYVGRIVLMAGGTNLLAIGKRCRRSNRSNELYFTSEIIFYSVASASSKMVTNRRQTVALLELILEMILSFRDVFLLHWFRHDRRVRTS